ncbi:MAG: sensor histidine kinase [Clostridia bacterium]|nr:sensor histidine kinase [Clostridia bacterium]
MTSNRSATLFHHLMRRFLLVCLIPLLTLGAFLYLMSARALEQSCMELATIFNSQVLTNLDELIEEYDRVTKSILVDFDVIARLNEDGDIGMQMEQQLDMRRLMLRLLTLRPEIRSITVLAENGRVYQVGEGGATVNGQALREEEWLRVFMDSGAILGFSAVHERAYADDADGGLAITVCRRILDYRGVYVGDLLIDLDPSSLLRLNDDFLLTRNAYNIRVAIADESGATLFDSDVASGRRTWRQAIDKGIRIEALDRNVVLSGVTRRCGLRVTTAIPRGSLLQRVGRIRVITLALTAALLLVIALLARRFSRSVAQPIGALKACMLAQEKGDYATCTASTDITELVSLIQHYNRMTLSMKELVDRVYRAGLLKKQAELAALQTQINPHMLYNTLESIRMKAMIAGEDEVADMIHILADMFRLALNRETDGYTLGDDLAYAEKYVALQNIRLPDVFRLEVDVPKSLLSCPIMPLLIQPLVENAIEHGYRGAYAPLCVSLAGCEDEGALSLVIANDGKVMTADEIEHVRALLEESPGDQVLQGGENLGLSNIQHRVRLSFGEGYGLALLGSADGRTAFRLRLPMTRKKEETAHDAHIDR